MMVRTPDTRRVVSFLLILSIWALTTSAFYAQRNGTVGRSLHVNGIDMYYETTGQGKPLVLLHGFTSSGAAWASMVPEFAKGYQVIVPDLRGHGRSTNPTKQFTHKQSALDVFALLDALGIEQFKAMGISSGGMTLIHIATQQPARVEAMVLIGATSYFPERLCAQLLSTV
jgi:pimeloyl-ACP methyl ester carboxylesterase